MENPSVANAIVILEVVAIAAIVWRLGKLRWFLRIPLATLLGWPVVIICTAIFWKVLAASADTPAEMEWVAAHDSGPLTVTLLFGWVYALFVIVAVELSRGLVAFTRRRAASRLGA